MLRCSTCSLRRAEFGRKKCCACRKEAKRGKAAVKKLTSKAAELRKRARVSSAGRFPKGRTKDGGGFEVRMALFFFYLVCREIGRVEHVKLGLGLGDCYTDPVFDETRPRFRRKLCNVDRMDDRGTRAAHGAVPPNTAPANALVHFALARRLHPAFMAAVGWVGPWTDKAKNRIRALASDWFQRRLDVFGYPGVLKAVRNSFCPNAAKRRPLCEFQAAFEEHVLAPTRAIWDARAAILAATDERTRSSSYEELVCCVTELPGFSEFRAGDLVNDFLECRLITAKRASLLFPDLQDWVYAGPGAKWGLNYVFRGNRHADGGDPVAEMQQLLDAAPRYLGEKCRLGRRGLPLSLRMVEFVLCEFQKWVR